MGVLFVVTCYGLTRFHVAHSHTRGQSRRSENNQACAQGEVAFRRRAHHQPLEARFMPHVSEQSVGPGSLAVQILEGARRERGGGSDERTRSPDDGLADAKGKRAAPELEEG